MKLNDSGCKRNAKPQFRVPKIAQMLSACLTLESPSPSKDLKIDTKPKNEWKCYRNFELHFSVKVYKIYVCSVKPH